MEDEFEKLGEIIDKLENIECAMDIPMPAEFHVKQLKSEIPKIVKELKDSYIKLTGENPWE